MSLRIAVYLKAGFRILTRYSIVIVPVGVFLAAERLLSGETTSFSLSQPLLEQALFLFDLPLVPAIILAATALKTVSVSFSNADMLLALQDSPNRYRSIYKTFKTSFWVISVVLGVLWNVFFAGVALAVIWLSETLSSPPISIAMIVLVGIALFPFYYSGYSLGAMVLVLKWLGQGNFKEFGSRVLHRWKEIYVYYLARGFADLLALTGIPILWAALIPNLFVGSILTAATILLAVAYLRATFVAYKAGLLLPHREP